MNLFSVFQADYDLQVHVPRKQFSELKQCPKCGKMTLQTVEDCYGIPVVQCGIVGCGFRSPTVEETAKQFFKSRELLEATKK
jgi:Zn ribbon nucleic-acid-binding protein